jgi:hypothetical protein
MTFDISAAIGLIIGISLAAGLIWAMKKKDLIR